MSLSFSAARLINLLTMIRDYLYSRLSMPRVAAGRAGRVYRYAARLRLPVRNVMAGGTVERRVYGFKVLAVHGALHVEPLLDSGIAPVAVYGPAKLYTAVYGALLLAYNEDVVAGLLRRLGVPGEAVAGLRELSSVVRGWYEALPRVQRPASHVYAASVEAPGDTVPGLGERCRVVRVVGYVDPLAPMDPGVRVECDGEPVKLSAGVAGEGLDHLYDMLAERVRDDLNLIESLRLKLSRWMG